MTHRCLCAFAVSLLAPLTLPSAQDPAPAPAPELHRSALLAEAFAKMATLPGVAFKTLEVQDNAMMRQLRGRLPGGFGEDVEVEGDWCHGVTHAKVGVDADEVVRYGGRTIARDDGAWKLRRDKLPSGAAMPFVLDPQLLFDVLRRIPAEHLAVGPSEPARYRDQDLVIVSATLEGEAAHDLALAGVFPQASQGGALVLRGGAFGGGGRDDVTVDLALYVDPESRLVHRLRVKCYQENPMAGQVHIAVAGGGVVDDAQEEEDEVQETDEHGRRVYKKGLPVRKLGDGLSLADFDVSFADHGKTFAVELDDGERELLALSR